MFNLKPFDQCNIESKFDFGIIVPSKGIPSFKINDKGKTFPMFGRMGMGGGSISMDVTRDDNIKLNLCIYPRVLHYLRALFTSKPLIPKTYKGMKAKESLLTRMLNDMERLNEEDLNGYRMEVTVIGRLSMGEVSKLAEPIIAQGLPSDITIVAQLNKETYVKNIKSAYSRAYLINAFRGRNEVKPTFDHLASIVSIYNSFGYSFKHWSIFLVNPPSVPAVTGPPSGLVSSTIPQEEKGEPVPLNFTLEDVYKLVYVRKPPGNAVEKQNWVCGCNINTIICIFMCD